MAPIPHVMLHQWGQIRTVAGAGVGGGPLRVRKNVWTLKHQVTGPVLSSPRHLSFVLPDRPHLNVQVEDFTCLRHDCPKRPVFTSPFADWTKLSLLVFNEGQRQEGSTRSTLLSDIMSLTCRDSGDREKVYSLIIRNISV